MCSCLCNTYYYCLYHLFELSNPDNESSDYTKLNDYTENPLYMNR